MRTPIRRHRLAAATVGVLTLTLLPGIALASHPEASLARSDFEIDVNANLKVDDDSPSTDWGGLANPDDLSGPEKRRTDAPTGANDDSYKGGVKEDTECPGEVTGSIPNNKSDLLTFSTYQEPGKPATATLPAHPGFLNLAWSRVSDPSGTTLMDFEFNQSSTGCSTGPNVVRTEGDILLEYAITQGGATATIYYRTWDDTANAWRAAQNVSQNNAKCGGGPCAVGTINTTEIPSGESDGLGTKQPRTFGEAQIDLRLMFDPNECTSFGSAMIKSRSSDAFTSQLKDFIAPIPLDLQNCASVIIRKVTDPAESPATTQFPFSKNFPTDPTSDNTFDLTHGESQDWTGQALLGSGYTVTETDDLGFDFDNVNCGASTGVTPQITGTTVTFALDSPTDKLDCTYTNRARGTIIVEKVTSSGSGAFDFTSNTLTPSPFTLTTTAAGAAGKDSRTFSNLTPGTYDVAETVPAGWNLQPGTCSDGSARSAIDLAAGETVTCTFTNDRELGAIRIVKTRKHAASGPGDHPHAGVTFTITGGNLPAAGVTRVTGAEGGACIDGLLISQFAGDYTVTETVPAGYAVVSQNPQTATVVESTCTDGVQKTFQNMPLTNISVSVDSQVAGGTASVISCDWDGNGSKETVTNTGAGGDGSNDRNNLQPGTYTCEVYVDP